MEPEQSLDINIKPSQLTGKWSLQQFHEYINLGNASLMTKKYFTQLDLISDYAQVLSQFSLSILSHSRNFKFQVKKRQVDQECHLLQIKFYLNDLYLSWKIILIQMDKIIKIYIKFFDSQNHKFITMDSFWFKYSLHINPKISNTYKIISIKDIDPKLTQKNAQLNCLFIARILQSFAQKSPEIVIKESENQVKSIRMITHFDNLKFFNPSDSTLLGQNLYKALGASENFIKICLFLDIKQIVRLKLVSRFIKIYLFNVEKALFKQLYECSYGKTGFDVNEMNWGKLLDKKRCETKKHKSKNPSIISQGIFRTH